LFTSVVASGSIFFFFFLLFFPFEKVHLWFRGKAVDQLLAAQAQEHIKISANANANAMHVSFSFPLVTLSKNMAHHFLSWESPK